MLSSRRRVIAVMLARGRDMPDGDLGARGVRNSGGLQMLRSRGLRMLSVSACGRSVAAACGCSAVAPCGRSVVAGLRMLGGRSRPLGGSIGRRRCAVELVGRCIAVIGGAP